MPYTVADRVRDTTTTTGTGAVTVSATAPVGYRTFSTVCAVNDTFPGFIAHQTANEWECGIYTYSSSNTVTRTTILSSSNAGAAVSFSAGTKDVVLDMSARNAFGRDTLFANRDYYVLTTGSNSNTGLVNSAGGAFLTLQKAMDVIGLLDLNGFKVTVNVGNGTFAGVTMNQAPTGGGIIAWTGINTTGVVSGGMFFNQGDAKFGGVVTFDKWKFASTSENCLEAGNGNRIEMGASLEFGVSTGQMHIVSGGQGSQITAFSGYTISGGASTHMFANGNGGIQVEGSTVTTSGTPAFSFLYAWAKNISQIRCTCTFAGTGATGTRYQAELNASIEVNGAGATYFPGNAAGSVMTGGQYN